MRSALLSGALALALAACAPTASVKHAEPRLAAAVEDLPHPPRRAPLRFEVRGRPFPLPLVRGTIAGEPTLMLVDTGATSHIIAGWFARKHRLGLKKLGDVGTDHVGKSITTYRIEKPDLGIDEWGPLVPGPALATDFPDLIEKLGIGAFISPQRLIDEGDAVVLDLRKGELRSAHWDAAMEELSQSGIPLVLGDRGRACAENEGPIKGLSFVVPATIEEHRVDLLVDTGAEHSDIFTTSTAGQLLGSQSTVNREAMYAASGQISARKLKGARVTTGSFSTLADVDLIGGAGEPSCPRDGVLAMDVLRSCVLLLGRAMVYGRCVP